MSEIKGTGSRREKEVICAAQCSSHKDIQKTVHWTHRKTIFGALI